MPLYDFRCDDAHTFEAIRPSEMYVTDCPCGQSAQRQFSSRVAIVGPTTDLRGMFRRYTEASAEIDGSTSGLWRSATAQANAMVAAGEAPVIHKEI